MNVTTEVMIEDVVNSFLSKEKDFELDSEIDREPIKVFQNGSNLN